jgi:hypothetical protein
VSQEPVLDALMQLSDAFQDNTISDAELALLATILPDVLKDMAMQIEPVED